MRSVTTAERRARLALRHHLVRPAPSVERAAAAMVGLHASDPVTVYLSARVRLAGLTVADMEDALYEARSVVRMLGMRRTLFVVPPDLAAAMLAACTRNYAPAERRRLERMLEDQDLAEDGARWVQRVMDDVARALAARSEATAVELTEDVPDLGLKLTFGEGKTWGGTVGVSTRILFLMATEGLIVRARPRGTWLSSQYRWAPLEAWLGGEFPDLDPAEARTDLARRWLASFGPGTLTDLKWWTGWTVRDTKAALASVEAVEVGLEDGAGFVLPGDLERQEEPAPWVALLPGLDPTVMGWKERDWYLGAHQEELFDRNGNAGPTVWSNGRIVGGWTQRADGEIAVALLEDPGAEAREAIDDEADRLREWLGDSRITPRFRSPLEKRLAG